MTVDLRREFQLAVLLIVTCMPSIVDYEEIVWAIEFPQEAAHCMNKLMMWRGLLVQ